VRVPVGVVVAGDLDAAARAAAAAGVVQVFVVGGAQLYRAALENAQLGRVYLTRIAARYGCDTHIPDLDAAGFIRDATWEGEAIGEDNGVSYRIERLVRPRPAA
jgi:dihydrofolate reductase